MISFVLPYFTVGPGHVLIAAYDERTCSQLRDVSAYSANFFSRLTAYNV